MNKIEGIKSVDFKITAAGEGAVNWNGSIKLKMLNKKTSKYESVENHSLPKLRGYTNITERRKENGDVYKDLKRTSEDIDFNETPLYISQNCIRHHLFKGENFNLQDPEVAKHMEKLLCSLTGLIRGYVIPKKEYKKTSALLITDFNETLKKGNFEQMSRSGSKQDKNDTKKSTSMFSKTTFGETAYEGYASISIEQLQFISLDIQFSRQTMEPNNEKQSKEIALQISQYLQGIGDNKNATATYHKNYVRKGSIFTNEKHGEAGILLNDEAIDVLVEQTKFLLENLHFRQAKGWMCVDTVDVDYNDSILAKNMFRIKKDSGNIQKIKGNKKYAIYFEGF